MALLANRWCFGLVATAVICAAWSDAEQVGPLSERLHAEWQLPLYLNKDTAVLVFARATPDAAPMRLSVCFAERMSGTVPADPLAVVLPGGKLRKEARVQIAEWPDGEYLTTIREDDGATGSVVRVLRKQTIPAPEPPREPIDVSGLTMLFVDDWHISKRRGLTRRVVPAETFPVTSGMLREGRPHQAPTELCFDAEGSAAVQFYTLDRRRQNRTLWAARSPDLVNWEFEEVGARAPGADGLARSRVTPLWRWHDPRGKKAVYRLYDPAADGPVGIGDVHVQYSGWDAKPTQWGAVDIAPRSTYPIWRKSETDYVVLTRDPLTTDRYRFADDEPGEWTDSNDNWGGQWLSPDGQTLHFCQARVIPRHSPSQVPYDHIRGSRMLVVWSTPDGLNWRPTYFTAAGEGDPPGLQFYGAYGFWAESTGLRLAYLWVYDQVQQQIGIELAYSRDSLLWHRLRDQPKLIENGPLGAWNFGLVAPMTAPPLERGDLAYHLLRGLNRPHFFLGNGLGPQPVDVPFLQKRLGGPRGLETWPCWQDFGSWQALADHLNSGSFTIGLMRHRRNGWVSLGAGPEAGVLVTRVLAADRTLYINARTRREGSIRIEVLGADGKALRAYCGANAATFAGDATDERVAWQGGKLTRLPGEPVRLRLRMQEAHLFALRF